MIGIRPRDGTPAGDAIIDEAAAFGGGGDDGLNHVVCCENQDLALCGKDCTGAPFDNDAEIDCSVCAELDEQPIRHGKCVGCPLEMRRERKRDG